MCAEFTRNKNQIEWRRGMVLDLTSKGHTQKEIADILKVDRSLISLDQKYWRERAKATVQQQLLDERIPVEVENVLNALNIIIKDTWNDITKTASVRDKTTARSLLKDIYLSRLEILTSSPVVQRGLSFVTEYKQRYEQLQLNKTETEEAEEEDIIVEGREGEGNNEKKEESNE